MISFFSEDVSFEIQGKDKVQAWLTSLVSVRHLELTNINYIFCSDDFLLDINRKYLQHDYYTDIITFDMSDLDSQIEGEIFISIERVSENAIENNTSFEQELHRVLAHGVLHLIGFNDTSKEEQEEMTIEENRALAQRKPFLHQ